jgi:hypothetical protein
MTPQPPATATEYLSPATAASLIGTSRSALHKWRRVGLRSGTSKVKLRAIRRGGRWMFTQAWIDEFFAALSSSPASYPERRRRPALAAGPAVAVGHDT